MSEALKERKEMDPQYQWDLTKMYASDAEWEKAFAAIDPKIEALAAWEGKLNNAASIREFYDAEIGVFRELENLAVYTSLRLSEDTRADDAQSMDARATAKYVKAVGTIAYAQPEILALPQETLDAIMADEQVAPYRFALEDLLRAKPHTLTAPEEKLLAAFGEAFGTPKNVADNLEDADMVFDSVKDGEGNDVELTASNYILLQTSNDRVLRKNAFESYYKSFRQHINTLDDFYAAIGYGGITCTRAVNRFKDEIARAARAQAQSHKSELDRINEAVERHSAQQTKAVQGVLVEGMDNCLIKFSRCCTPVPGDPIVGFITRGQGVSIHRTDCANYARREFKPEDIGRWINVSWADEIKESYATAITVVSRERNGLIMDIASIFNTLNTKVRTINARDTGDKSIVNITLETSGIDELRAVVNRISALPGVVEVNRNGGKR